tara:strand:+ start:3845 stop:5560 length:1716 start_codon:yes stop_codon:yes gene_type:complete
MIKKRLKKLKKLIVKNNLDGYIVPKNDAYFSEFSIPDRLNTISNFTGSFGYALILKNNNYLFVDGRYTIQAKKESGKFFNIIEIPYQLPKDIINKLNVNLSIGFDPQLFTNSSLTRLFHKSCNVVPVKTNLIDQIKLPEKRDIAYSFYSLKQEIAGETINSKISRLIKILKKNKIDNIFISAPENVAWLLNIRGKDNPYSPIPNCKIILSINKKIFFFSCPKKIKKIRKENSFKNIEFSTYKNFFKILKLLKGRNFSIDSSTCSVANQEMIKKRFNIKGYNDPCYLMKSIKNKKEIHYMKNSHIEDGLALIKFIYWIKNEINNGKKVSELEAQIKLEKFRKLNKNYLYPSFNTIAGTGSNGAIIHYRATKKSSKTIRKHELFLCDSGGQYKYGTTDVTRTISFSKHKTKIKNIYTKVLKGHIAVTTSNLSKYQTGKQIDIRARRYLNEAGLDYAHGTGHGVGFFSNVHEGPQSISKYNNIKLMKGMILSNEPGFYKENQFGIRIENLIYINNKKKPYFENLTLAPIEKELINNDLLNKEEKKYLKNYHIKIYNTYKKFLFGKEKDWLRSHI